MAGKKTKSLSRKFFRRSIAVLLVGQAVTMALVWTSRMRVEEQELSGRAAMFGRIAAGTAYRAQLDNDYTYLTLLVNDLLKDPDVLSVAVKDGKGQELTYQGEQPKRYHTSLQSSAPIESREGVVGTVKVAYTFDNIRYNLFRHLLQLAGLQAVILLSLLLVVRYFFRRDVGSNLAMLGAQLERVREGDLRGRLEVGGETNEISIIAQGLDFVVDQLAATITKMNHIADDLRVAVNQTGSVVGEVVASAEKQKESIDNSFTALNEGSRSLAQISEGTARIQSMTRHNRGTLILVKGAFEETVRIVDSLDGSMAELNTSINELTHSSRAVAGLAEDAAACVNDVSAAMAQLDSSVKGISSEVRTSTALSEEATGRIASKGIAAVGNAIETMGRIESFFASLSGTITGLDGRSNDIAKIVNAIYEVSDQVNLLSLNALIIAAQAGENGKGFSVVAMEMKELALRAGRSAKEIEVIIKSIQDDIHSAVSESEETAKAVQEGKTMAVITGEVIDEILNVSSRSTAMAQQIADSASVQNRLIEEVQVDVARLRGLNEKVKHATVEEDGSTRYILDAAGRISGSLGETRRQAEEQFQSLKSIAENIGDSDTQLEDIALQSARQLAINKEVVDTIGGNVAMAEGMVAAVQNVSKEIGSVFYELERLREEVRMFRT